MDLRGITGVIAPENIVAGRFFLLPDHEGGLLLCLRATLSDGEQEARSWDIVFDRKERHGLYFTAPYDLEPVAEPQPISVRIDLSSLAGTSTSTIFRNSMLAVVGKDVFLKVANDGRGSLVVNLATGQVRTSGPPSGWVAFSGWSLVTDKGDEEIVLFNNGSDT